MRYLLLSLIVSLAYSSASMAENIAIVNGKLHTMGDLGTLENGTLLLTDGKISAIGQDISVPSGYRVIDAGGRPVTPGLFDAISSIGLSEVTLSAGIEDDEARTSRFKIAPDASYAFSPDNTFVPSTRINGVTRTATSMKVTNSIFAGQGALVHLGLGPTHVTHPRAFLYADLGEKGGANAGGSRAALWVELHAAFDEADALMGGRTEWEGGKGEPLYARIDLEALMPAMRGDIPFVVHVNKPSDIRHVIALKKERTAMRIVIFGGSDAWRIADELAEADIPVLVHPLNNLPTTFSKIGSTMENAARLRAAGVKVAFTSWGRRLRHYGARLLPHFAGNAVANGMSREDALIAITRAPAEIYGVDDEVGTLSPGKDADVVIWSGDPLEVMEAPTHVIIRGDEIPLVSRQTELRDRYRQVP